MITTHVTGFEKQGIVTTLARALNGEFDGTTDKGYCWVFTTEMAARQFIDGCRKNGVYVQIING